MEREKQIWYAILPERGNNDASLQMAQRIAYRAGSRKYHPIFPQYGRTDITRQGIAEAFMQFSKRPDDTLVMFDIDHDHPIEMIETLVGHDKPIVVPLMFRRGEPYEACAFIVDDTGGWHNLADFRPGLRQMNAVGSGAIAIQRQVFTRLIERGHDFFWKYEYLPAEPAKGLGKRAPSEDLYFSKICDAAGIEMFVDTTIETPHMTLGFIDKSTHLAYMEANPDVLGIKVEAGKLKGGNDEQLPMGDTTTSGHISAGLEQSRPDQSAYLVN